jgi:hypothetical protein
MSMRPASICRAGLLLLLLPGADAAAKIYQCQVEGRTVYTDQPCGGLGSETQNLYVSPAQAARASEDTAAPAAKPAATPAAALAVPADAVSPVGARPAAKPRRAPRPPAPRETGIESCAQDRDLSCRGMAPTGADAPSGSPSGSPAPARASEAPGKWRLAGEYSDRIADPAAMQGQGRPHMVKRSSYGIICEATGARRRVYAVDGRYSLATPKRRGALDAAAPLFDSLEAAAGAACAGES